MPAPKAPFVIPNAEAVRNLLSCAAERMSPKSISLFG